MQEQTLSSDNNTQEQQLDNLPKKRGPKPKIKPESIQSTTQLEVIHINESEKESESKNYTVDTPDFKTLIYTIETLKQQNEKLLHIVETINITTTKPLIICSDDDINTLYVNYLANKETVLNNVVVAEVDGRVIITKSYYEVG